MTVLARRALTFAERYGITIAVVAGDRLGWQSCAPTPGRALEALKAAKGELIDLLVRYRLDSEGALVGDDLLDALRVSGFRVRRYGLSAALDGALGGALDCVPARPLLYAFADKQAEYALALRALRAPDQLPKITPCATEKTFEGPLKQEQPLRTFIELFAGIGCARVGLDARWHCSFANDIDPKKATVYRANFGADHFRLSDIRVDDLPDADLVWASPPCVDLSEAGQRGGIHAERSGLVWRYVELVRELQGQRRAPKLALIENVRGMVNGREGQDVIAVVEALADSGYAVGAAVIDAKLFVPQSRPRVFIVAVRGDLAIPAALSDDHPTAWCSTEALVEALDGRRVWWPKLPLPTGTPIALEGCFDASAHDWIAMRLSDFGAPSQRALGERLDVGGRHLGTIFRRTRDGSPVWECRFDGRAGALRVASGGSSRQSWVRIEAGKIERRFFTPREAARVMGLPDGFRLPPGNDGLTAVGDGVCPQVVRFLAQILFEPILAMAKETHPQRNRHDDPVQP